MTTIVKRDNIATIPPEIAVAFGIREGTRLECTDTGSGMIAVKPLPSRSERARALMGSGRKWLKPGDDPIANLLRDRAAEDSQWMTHLFDTSAILAHHLAEFGADRMQTLFEDETNHVGICVVSFLEFEVRLREMGLSESERQGEKLRYNCRIDKGVREYPGRRSKRRLHGGNRRLEARTTICGPEIRVRPSCILRYIELPYGLL